MRRSAIASLLFLFTTLALDAQSYSVKPLPKGAKVSIQVPDVDCDSTRLRDRLVRNLTDKELAPVDGLSEGAFILRVRFKKRITRVAVTRLVLEISVRERAAKNASTVNTSWDDAETVTAAMVAHAVMEQVTVFGPKVRRVKVNGNYGDEVRSGLMTAFKELGYSRDDTDPDLTLNVTSRQEPSQRQFEFLDYDFKLESRAGQQVAYGTGTIQDREVAGIPIDSVAYAAQRITGAISVR